jgi:parallel beta-helix repeat protein
MMKTFQTLLLSTILLASFVAVIPLGTVHAQPPAVIFVSPTGSDTAGNGSAATPYATISHGVKVAPLGAEVIVMPGTYHEMVNFSKPIYLISASGQPSNTIINAAGFVHGIEVLGTSVNASAIEGFTVENANAEGIFVQDASNTIIANNQVLNNVQDAALVCPFGGPPAGPCILEDKGIELIGTKGATVASNTVVGTVADGGIGLSDDGPLNPGNPCTLNIAAGTCAGIAGASRPSIDNVVTSNTVIANTGGCGIVVSAYNPGQGVIGNVVTNNDVVANAEGIVVATPLPGTSAINNTIIGNSILNSFTEGVDIDASSGAFAPTNVVSGNSVIGNVIGGNGPDGDFSNPQPTGIAVISPTSLMVKGTTVSGNTIRNEYYGIGVFNSTGTTILSNTMDSSVARPITGTAANQSSIGALDSQFSSLQASLGTLQSSLSQLQGSISQLQSSSAKSSDLSALSSTVTSLQSSLSQLQSSAAKQSDLTGLSAAVNSASTQAGSANSQAQTATYLGYAAIAVALVFGGTAIVLSRRRPSPATS